jgi:hypothetical protein
MQEFSVGAGLAALGFWLFVAAIVVAGIWDSMRKRDAEHETFRRIVESGQPVSDEAVRKLLGNDKRLDRDLKVGGLITVTIAPGLALMAWALGFLNPQAMYPVFGAALLTGCVGIGLLIAANYAKRSIEAEEAGTAPYRRNP